MFLFIEGGNWCGVVHEIGKGGIFYINFYCK